MRLYAKLIMIALLQIILSYIFQVIFNDYLDLNYKKFNIELLSPRQIAEIERLDKLVILFVI